MTGAVLDELAVTDVWRRFGRRAALRGVSFRLRAGEVVGLLGPNGAGKSTLLSVLATLVRPTSGRVTYGVLDAATDDAAIRREIGFLGHELGVYPELTARENLQFFGTLCGVPDVTGAAARALARAGLAGRADDPVSSYSRGMRQRLGLERVLLHGPRLVLLDEPFTGLDDASNALLVGRLRELRDAGAMILLATHDLDLVDGLIDRALVLVDGRLDELSPGSPVRAAYRAHVSARTGATTRS
jgi:heme ABC exporter ATP-binding subunit CcmA